MTDEQLAAAYLARAENDDVARRVEAARHEGVAAERERCAALLESRAADLDRWLSGRCYDDQAEAAAWRAEAVVLRREAARIREGKE